MKAALVMEDQRKSGVYGRIIAAGGGVVRDANSLWQIAETPGLLSAGQLTHVFMDPWAVSTDTFKKLKSLVESKDLKIWFLHYKYLFLKVKADSGRWSTEMEHSVLNARLRK